MTAVAPVTDAPVDRRSSITDLGLAAITALVTLPVLWLGYGTDLDIEALLLAGERMRGGDYAPSRNPGVPVVEAIVGVLDPWGGHLAINLATAVALGATVIGIARLVQAYGRPNGDLVALAFLTAPVTVIAGTSTVDFVWALCFLVWGVLAHLRSQSLLAGVLLALAIGSRSSTALLVVALVVADGWAPEHRRRCAITSATALPLAALLYVPAWVSYDRTLAFLDSSNGWQSLPNNLGRHLYKNYATIGTLAIVLVIVAAPALLGSLRRWSVDPLVRFGVLGFVMTQALFLVMPWKPAHLLPSVLCLLLWLAATRWNRRTYLWMLIVAIAVNGLIAFRPLAPDDPDSSGSAVLDPTITLGLLANDIRCRARFMHDPPNLESGAWSCTLEPIRGPAEPPTRS